MDFAYRLHMHYKNIRIFPWNIYYICEYLFIYDTIVNFVNI